MYFFFLQKIIEECALFIIYRKIRLITSRFRCVTHAFVRTSLKIELNFVLRKESQ